MRIAWIIGLCGLWACRAAPSAAEVPLELTGPGRAVVVVAVKVNGQGPFAFTLDTGATITLVSPEVAQASGLPVVGKGEATGAGGKFPVTLARANEVSVGNAVARDLPVGIFDVSPLGGVMGTKIDGILGHNFLQLFRVTIDYRSSRLRLE